LLAIRNLIRTCAKISKKRVLYLGFTATTHAFELQRNNSVLKPHIIAFMLMNIPSYLGIEHFTSPQWLDHRNKVIQEDIVDFVITSEEEQKPSLVPVCFRPGLFQFVLKMYGKAVSGSSPIDIYDTHFATLKQAELEKVKSAGDHLIYNSEVSYHTVRVEIARIFERLRMVLEASDEYKGCFTPDQLRHIADYPPPPRPQVRSSSKSAQQTSPKKLAIKSAVESIRPAEMVYLKLTWNIDRAPQWSLLFVFRSLMCWAIYQRRLSHKENNLWTAIASFLDVSPKEYLRLLSSEHIEENPKTDHSHLCFLSTLSDSELREYREMKRNRDQFHRCLDRFFQFTRDTKGMPLLNFLSHLFKVNITLIPTGEKTEHLEYQQRIFITVNSRQYEVVAEPIYTEQAQLSNPDRLTAFIHTSSRQLAHSSCVDIIKNTLEVLRQQEFWGEYTQPGTFERWYSAMMLAYQHIVDLHEAYKSQEHELGTLSTARNRPAIPALVDLLPDIKRILHAKDHNGNYALDVAVKMGKKLRTCFNIRDLNDENLPRYLIVVGGNCFSRGVTVPDPLVSVFFRVPDNQEDSAQYMRWLGHRKPEAFDLMSVYIGLHQKRLFSKFWATMSHNTIRLIHSWLEAEGGYDESAVKILALVTNSASQSFALIKPFT